MGKKPPPPSSSPPPGTIETGDNNSRATANPGSNTLLEEIREVLAQSYLIFLLADLRLMSGTGRIRTKYETLVIDSDLYPKISAHNLAGLVEPTTTSTPSPSPPSIRGVSSSDNLLCTATDPVQNHALSPVQIMAILLIELKETFEGHAKQKKERKRYKRNNSLRHSFTRKSRRDSAENSEENISSNNSDDGEDSSRADQDDQFIYYKTDPNSKRQAEDSMESLLRAYSRMVANDLKVEVPHIRKRRINVSNPDMMVSSSSTNSPGGGGTGAGRKNSDDGAAVIFMSDRNLMMKHADLNLESVNESINEFDNDYADESFSMLHGDDESLYTDLNVVHSSSSKMSSSDLHINQQQNQQQYPVPHLQTPPSTITTITNIEEEGGNSNSMPALATPPALLKTSTPPVRRRHSSEGKKQTTTSAAMSYPSISRRHSNDDGRHRPNNSISSSSGKRAPTTRRNSNEEQGVSSSSYVISPNDPSKKRPVHTTPGNVFNLDSIHEGHHDDDSGDDNDKSSRHTRRAASRPTATTPVSTLPKNPDDDSLRDAPSFDEAISADSNATAAKAIIIQGESATLEFHTPYKGDGEESVFSLKSATTAPPNLQATAIARNNNNHNLNNGDENTNTTVTASLDPHHELPPPKYTLAAMRANFSATKRQEMAESLRSRRQVLRQQYAERRGQLRQEFAARRAQLRQEFTDRVDMVMKNNVITNPRSPNRDAMAELEFQELTTALFDMGTDPEQNSLGKKFRGALGVDSNATDEEIMQVMKRAVESRQPGRLSFMSNLFKEGSVSQLMVESSSKIVWMNDWYPLKDLTYAIAVDQKLKRVLVVFRGAITKADWQNVRKISFTSVTNPVKEDFPGKSKRILVFSGLYKYLFRPRKDTGTTKYHEIANLADKYGREMIGDDYNLVVTGHSLGGALAVYFSLHASTEERFTSNGAIKSFAFGTPFLGNHYFADAFRHQERQGKLQCVRIFNHNDAIPHLPFNFVVGKRGCRWRHIGIEVILPSVPWWGRWSPVIRYNGAKEKNWLQSTIHGYRQNVLFHYPWGKPWSYQRMHTLFELQDRLMYGIETKKKGGSFDLFQKTVDDLYEILAETDFTTINLRKKGGTGTTASS